MKFWIARDLSDLLWLFEEKPYLNIYKDWDSNENYFMIDENKFPEVTFGNSPQEVELKLIKTV